MAEVSALIEGGKATAGAPLGPALGPLGVNIGEIVAKINEKTKGYSGMKVPVTVEVNKDKSYEILVGSPPTSAIITKEIKAQKGGANQRTDVVGNLSMEQVKKLAEMKLAALTSTNLYSAAREIVGTCNSMGVSIEGKHAKIVQQEFRDGQWNSFFGREEKPSEKAGKIVEVLKKDAKLVVEKTEKIIEKAAEKAVEVEKEIVKEVKEAEEKVIVKIHEATAPKPKEEVKVVKEEKAEVKVPLKEVHKAEVKKESAEVKKEAAPEKKAVKETPVQKDSESYSQHMSKVEKGLGIAKKEAEEKPKKVETEVTSTPNSEITRPKKKQE